MENFDFENFDQTQFEGTNLFEQNSKMQKVLAQHILNFIPGDSKASQVDFFFYSDSLEKAEALSKDLKKINYEVEIFENKNGIWSICGCTNEMEINDRTIDTWVQEMCEMAYINDCRFDGWGYGFEIK